METHKEKKRNEAKMDFVGDIGANVVSNPMD